MARVALFSLLILSLLSPTLNSQTPFWSLEEGTSGFFISDLTIAPSNPDSLFVTGAGPLLVSGDAGLSWDSLAPGSCCGVLAVDMTDPSILFLNETGLPYDGNAVLKSTDTGKSWTQLLDGVCIEKKGCAAPILAYGSPGAPGLYASINPYFIKRSTDRGITWKDIPIPDRNGLWSIAFSAQSTSVVYIAFADSAGVFRTSDGGISWEERSLPLTVETAVHLAVDPQDDDVIYAGLENFGIFKSTDGGFSWEQRNVGLNADQLDIRAIAINPHQTSEVFAGLGDGDPFDGVGDLLVVSVDGAKSWTPLNSGLPHSGQVNRLLFDPRMFRVYAVVVSPHDSFAQSGIYHAGILTTAGESEADHPVSAHLDQNYPNPFNSSTQIAFVVPERGMVRILVHDLLGRQVAVLADQVMEKGRKTLRWDAGGLPSSVYFYTLITGTHQITRPLTLIR